MWQQEMGMEMNEFQGENFEYGSEFEDEMFGEYEGEYEGEYGGEYEGEYEGEMGGEFEGEYPLHEMQEMELAAELLSVTNEAELEQFIGNIFKKVAGFAKGPMGKALGGALKGIAKKALPVVGGALGSFIAPGVGTAIGSSLGSAAGKLFGLELEGLSNEDREFEVARRYVRLATSAARHAAAAPQNMHPRQVAKSAITMAARRHAPGLLNRVAQRPRSMAGRVASGPAARGYQRRPPTAYQSSATAHHQAYRPPYRVAPQQAYRAPYGSTATSNYQTVYGGAPAPAYQDSYWDSQPSGYQDSVRTGRWVRRGRYIIIIGA